MVVQLTSLRSAQEDPVAALAGRELSSALPNLVTEEPLTFKSLEEPLLYPQDLAMPALPEPIAPAAYLPTSAGWDDEEDLDLAPFRTMNKIAWPNANGGDGHASSASGPNKGSAPSKGGIGNGEVTSAMEIVHKPVYLGGIGDGHTASAMPILYKPTYLGGIGDGHSTAATPMFYKPTYLGGMGDGDTTAGKPRF